MTDSRVSRRRFMGLAAGAGVSIAAAPLVTGRGVPGAAGNVGNAKGVAPGKLMYLAAWELGQYLDAIASITPGGWVRTDIDWATVERLPGQYDWTGADRAVYAARQRGLGVIAILGTAPAWANGGQDWHTPPLDPRLMAPFARAAAMRYGPLGVVFEVWNEPNYNEAWRWPNPATYTALLKVAYREIKAVSPGSLVITGGLAAGGAPRPADFVRGMYAAGARGYFDGLGYHPYCGSSPPLVADSAVMRTQELRELLVANGDGAKQIWGTEIGWRVELLGVTESQQATYLSQAYAKWREWYAAGWVGPLLWYNLRDQSSFGLFDRHSQSGLYRYNWTGRPALWALRSA